MWENILTELRPEILLRVALTCLAGFVLGTERERHGRAAGLRTTMLVCLAGCVTMLISEFYYVESFGETAFGESAWRPDPTRLAAGALSGVGFLGAGVIIRQSNNAVHGVTTAATIWFASVVGLCFGAGVIGIGVISTILAFLVLYALPKFEDNIHDDYYSEFTVSMDGSICTIESIMDELKQFGIKVKTLALDSDSGSGDRNVSFTLKYKKEQLIELAMKVSDKIGKLPGVRSTSWKA